MLERLHKEIKGCTKCPLHTTRKNAVPGCCNPHSQIMFVGEAPGRYEDEAGLPFVGRAGKLLDELLGGIGLSRSDIFITSILKCRPPKNRLPTSEEVEACAPHLLSQIDIINPKIICSLGNVATGFFSNKWMRGGIFKWNERNIFPTYHPAAALYNPALKKTLERDFRKMKVTLDWSNHLLDHILYLYVGNTM